MWCNDACDAMMYVTYWFTWSNYFSIVHVIHRLYSKVKSKCVYVWSMLMHGFMWCNDWCDVMCVRMEHVDWMHCGCDACWCSPMIYVMQWFRWRNDWCNAVIYVMQWFMWCSDLCDAMIYVMQWFMWRNFSSDVIMYVMLYVSMYA